MIISLIVAAASNNAIGKDGQLPWHLPEDMKHFKNITWGMPVIMGRKTFESLGKPLPGRKNIIVTRQPGWKQKGTVGVKTIEDALFLAKETDAKEAMVIGGGEIYKSLFDKAKRIYMTRVEAEPEADTFFPELDTKEWKLVAQEYHSKDEKHLYDFTYETYLKKP